MPHFNEEERRRVWEAVRSSGETETLKEKVKQWAKSTPRGHSAKRSGGTSGRAEPKSRELSAKGSDGESEWLQDSEIKVTDQGRTKPVWSPQKQTTLNFDSEDRLQPSANHSPLPPAQETVGFLLRRTPTPRGTPHRKSLVPKPTRSDRFRRPSSASRSSGTGEMEGDLQNLETPGSYRSRRPSPGTISDHDSGGGGYMPTPEKYERSCMGS
jgi:hypothetical protein